MKVAELRTKNLISGTLVYFIGTFISKGLSFIMMPFLTVRLTTEQYGDYDMISTVMMLLLPLLTLQTIEAIFRFLYDANKKKEKELLSTVWSVVLIGSFCFGAVLLILPDILGLYSALYIWLYYLLTAALNMYQRVARSKGLNRCFATSGIIQSVFLAGTQLIVIYCFTPTVNGLLVSYIFSTFIACLYLEIKTKSLICFSYKKIHYNCLCDVIRFGLPLVPNNVSWWAASAVNKVIITASLGGGANGIYAVAFKFSTLVQTVTNIFQLAWQENAIVSYNSEGSENYNSKIANLYVVFLLCGTSIGLGIIKLLSPCFIGESFRDAIQYIPPLVYAACFMAIAQFYGAGYIASTKTRGALNTTIVGALINIVICYIGIKPFGLLAPAISTMMAYLVIWILRSIQMKSYFSIKLKPQTLWISAIFSLVSILVYYFGNVLVNILCSAILSIIIVVIYGKKMLPPIRKF